MITARPEIETISPYQGGKPIEEVQREFKLNDIIKLASNETPWSFPQSRGGHEKSS